MLSLDPAPNIITFDCYGTLVQWHAALRSAVEAVLSRHGMRASGSPGDDVAAATVNTLREAAMALQLGPYRSYRTILRAALATALTEAGHQPTEADGDTLLSSLHAIPPHPEVPAAMERLRARYRLAIISNTDDDLIAGTVAGLGVPIDFVVTAEQARAYKPDHRLFEFAHRAMGVTKDETVHVGMGQFTDMKVCRECGIRGVWIDRSGEPANPVWASDAVLPDLARLPDLLLAAGG